MEQKLAPELSRTRQRQPSTRIGLMDLPTEIHLQIIKQLDTEDDPTVVLLGCPDVVDKWALKRVSRYWYGFKELPCPAAFFVREYQDITLDRIKQQRLAAAFGASFSGDTIQVIHIQRVLFIMCSVCTNFSSHVLVVGGFVRLFTSASSHAVPLSFLTVEKLRYVSTARSKTGKGYAKSVRSISFTRISHFNCGNASIALRRRSSRLASLFDARAWELPRAGHRTLKIIIDCLLLIPS